MEVNTMVKNINWLGHDTFKIVGERTVFTDPFKLERDDKADIILITHDHFDHCSPDDVRRIQGPDTVVVATPDCAEKLTGDVRTVRPGDSIEVMGVAIEAVPAYNTHKDFHPRENNWVGYIFTLGGKRIYHAGDTDRIPEMKGYKCDIALLPVSGTFVMTSDEAAEAALDIKPGVAVPMHYASIVGSEENARDFASTLQGKVEVVVLEEQ